MNMDPVRDMPDCTSRPDGTNNLKHRLNKILYCMPPYSDSGCYAVSLTG